MESNVYVMDTSGFIVGTNFNDGTMVTVPGVVDEIIDSSTQLRFDLLLDSGLKVESPLDSCIEHVISAAKSTGDDSVLSRTDLAILAKALESLSTGKVILITDDYAVQNVAASLGIEYRSAGSKGIKKNILWELKCRGCGAIVKSGNECPICGSEVRRHRVRGKNILD
jgi:UPF0271 protein